MDTLSDLRNNLSLKEQDILATNLSLVLEKQEKQKKEFALKKQDQLRSVLNGMEAYICVSSVKTFDILFLNTVMIKAFGLEGIDYIGKKCYKLLQGLDEKCPDCPHTKLIDAPNKTLNWVQYDRLLKKRFQKTAKLIRWDHETSGHLEYGVELIEQK